ncbi:Sorting nexin-30 [Clonorchis sinensis]|uniref:Sorting nexin-30 n=1 Tax=Clonorchis sinensis TaxID=79923 RepID=A0A8T1MLS8_CLOSI|nr:Sorting nexin-30 [Clonorchis sinensis]
MSNCNEPDRAHNRPLFLDGMPDEGIPSRYTRTCNIFISRYRKFVSTYETFVLFRIITDTRKPEYPGGHFEVERRYSDFEWLHSRLTQLHPSLFIPPLPGKMLTTALDRFSDNFLRPRALGLQLFLARLSRHPVLFVSPDVIAFLTLLREDFGKYRSSHAPVGLLSHLLSDTRSSIRNLINSGHSGGDEEEDSVTPQAALGLIGSSAMREYEREFQDYSDETEKFLAITQRLARATEFVSHQLENLGMGFAELARCLEMWPPSLVVDVAGQTASNASQLQALLTPNPPTMNLKWDRDRPSAPAVIANVTQVVAKETTDLSTRLKNNTLVHWRDAAQYAQSVRAVLNSRGDLENRYFSTVEDLKVESENPSRGQEGRFTRFARGYFSWNQRSLSQLVFDANQLQDQVSFVNGQIRAEFGRWRAERREELMENLVNMSQSYVLYWSRVVDAWRSAAVELGPDLPSDQAGLMSTAQPSNGVQNEEVTNSAPVEDDVTPH